MDNGASSYRRFRETGDNSGLAEVIREYRDGLVFYLNSIVGDTYCRGTCRGHFCIAWHKKAT